jgi:hypothetical protein
MTDKTLPAAHIDRLRTLVALANHYVARQQFAKAEPLYKDAISAQEDNPPDPLMLAETLERYGALLRLTKRTSEAEGLESRARTLRQPRAAARASRAG